MDPCGHTKSLCTNCAGFDWATWLQDTSNASYLLHQRFASVFEGASQGCSLCAMIAHKYNQITSVPEDSDQEEGEGRKDERSTSIEGSMDADSILSQDEVAVDKTKSSHQDCYVVLQAIRDPFTGLQVVDLAIQLLPNENVTTDESGYAVIPQNSSATDGPSRVEIPRTGSRLIMGFGVSCPSGIHRPSRHSRAQLILLAPSNGSSQWCMIRSFPVSHDPLRISPSRLSWIQDQLSACRKLSSDHESCGSWAGKSMSEMPTRVIDCHKLCLVETSPVAHGAQKLSAPYTILSHCWGDQTGLKTTPENYKNMCHSFELYQLPPTVRDAVILSRDIGIPYIWIDSFCIIQSTQPGTPQKDTDWMLELPRMCKYYQNAALTLVIESAKGDHEGFIHRLNTREKGVAGARNQSACVPLHVETGSYCLNIDDEIHRDLMTTADNFWAFTTFLRHRAWTLQEIVLSPRKLHIWGGDMVWSCVSAARHDKLLQAMQPSSVQQRHPRVFEPPKRSQVSYYVKWNERIPEAIKAGSMDSDTYLQQLLFEDWYHFVADSQCRRISFASDRLPAISAIASDVSLKTGDQYYAGLWIQDLARGLAWRTFGLGVAIPTWRAPTWSWAGLDCKKMVVESPYEYRRITETFQRDEYTLKLEGMPTQLGTHVLLSPPASLTVEAHVLSFTSWPEDVIIPTTLETFQSRFSMKKILHLQCEFDLDLAKNGDQEPQYFQDDLKDIVLVRLGTWVCEDTKQDESSRFGYALMMEDNSDETYSRVGIAKIPDTEKWWEKGWKRVKLTLV